MSFISCTYDISVLRISFASALQYGRLGSQKLVDGVCGHLRRNAQSNPYPIPVGGSNAVGTWGYINGVDELMGQLESAQKDDPSSPFA